MPALLDVLRRSMFGDYPTSFLNSASAVRVYLEGATGEGWIEQNVVNCELVHSSFAVQLLPHTPDV